MRKRQCLLFVLKRSYICHYTICMTIPLKMRFTQSKGEAPLQGMELQEKRAQKN